jgi:hypothetical protein
MRIWPLISLLGAAVVMATLDAAPPPKNSRTPMTARFRCPETLECASVDGIQSDGSGPYRGAAAWPETGPYLDGRSHLYFPLQPGNGRFVAIDFSSPLATPPCATSATCRKNFTTLLTDDSLPASITNPIDAAGSELPNGFLSLAVGQSARARYKLNFADPAGRSLLWTVRFNSSYAGSSDLTVTRTAIDTWDVEAVATDVALLLSTTTAGKTVEVNEGYYAMPFKLTVTR